MELLPLIKAIVDYGVMFVLAGVAIYFYIRMQRRYEQLTKQLLDRVLIEKPVEEQKQHVQLMQDRISKGELIRASMRRLSKSIDADYVYIFEFHNTGQNMLGFPFAKATMTYERKGPTDKHISIIRLWNGVPISMLTSILLRSKRNPNGTSVIKLKSCASHDNDLLELFVNMDIHTCIVQLIQVDDVAIGLVIACKHEDFQDVEHAKLTIQSYATVFGEQVSIQS